MIANKKIKSRETSRQGQSFSESNFDWALPNKRRN